MTVGGQQLRRLPTVSPMGDARSFPWSLGTCELSSRISVDRQEVSLVEEVSSDPDVVRSFALDSQSWTEGRGHYPGRFFFSPIPTKFYCSALSDILGVKVEPSRNYRFAPFALIERPEEIARVQKSTPHSDRFCDYVAVICLSRQENPPSTAPAGTSFWRHSPTGMSSAPRDWPSKRVREELGSGCESAWLPIAHAAMRYNQMVVFPAALFHRIELGIASRTGRSGYDRLTQNLYLVRRA